MPTTRPVVLLILDGWGCAPDGPGNALSLARTPNLDRLQKSYPSTCLDCSGLAVGLPRGFMGNSEVGHMNIGAGRVLYQDMTRIDLAIEDGSFFTNRALTGAVDAAKTSGGALHLMGLVSDGGVHSHQNHIFALLKLARERGLSRVFLHAFLDGRDTPPSSGLYYLETLNAEMKRIGVGEIATVMGRFYAMDRDRRWERNEKAYKAMVRGEGIPVPDALSAVREAYTAGQTDEFVEPRVVTTADQPVGRIADNDAVIFFNFRADRARQICRSLFDPDFAEFPRGPLPRLSAFATMTEYDKTFPLSVAFPPQGIEETLGQVVSAAGCSQLRIAETEKYAHVTYFLNCGREEPWPGEERLLVPSPREVPTYDLKPEMSCPEITAKLLGRLPDFDLVVCNLANLDMVGHTGSIPAVVTAIETVDGCVGRIVDRTLELGGTVLLTADHGNSEEMLDACGNPQTAHSLNPVPLVYISRQAPGQQLASGGRLADIAPTVLALLGLPQPEAMTGRNLISPTEAVS